MPLMLVEQRSVPLFQAGAVDRRRRRLDHRLLAPVPTLAADSARRVDHARLLFGGRWLALVGLIAFLPAIPYVLVALSWIFGGLGMGLAMSSTSLAVMSLSAAAEQAATPPP